MQLRVHAGYGAHKEIKELSATLRTGFIVLIDDFKLLKPRICHDFLVSIRCVRSEPADFRLPGLWCSDDHSRNTCTQTVHPLTASASRRTMSTGVFRYPNQTPTLHRPEPMREGFAWWRKIYVACSPPQRKIGGICFETIHMADILVRQTGLLVRSNDRVSTQIPIAPRLSHVLLGQTHKVQGTLTRQKNRVVIT
jgi:hypothetical protein